MPKGLSQQETVEYAELVQQARDIQSRRRGLDSAEQRRALSAQARAAQLAALSRAQEQTQRRIGELESPDPDFALRPADDAALRRLAVEHGLAVVLLQPLDEPALGTVGFLIHPGSPDRGPAAADLLRLTGLTRDGLHDLLFTLPAGVGWDQPEADLLAALVRQPERVGWFRAYWLTHRTAGARGDSPEAARRLWHSTLERVLRELGYRVVGPLAARLRNIERQTGCRRVVIIPGDRLGLLPLHAVPTAADQTFGDEFEISYAPSATSLQRCLEHAEQRK